VKQFELRYLDNFIKNIEYDEVYKWEMKLREKLECIKNKNKLTNLNFEKCV
jgi:hypothetical protein